MWHNRIDCEEQHWRLSPEQINHCSKWKTDLARRPWPYVILSVQVVSNRSKWRGVVPKLFHRTICTEKKIMDEKTVQPAQCSVRLESAHFHCAGCTHFFANNFFSVQLDFGMIGALPWATMQCGFMCMMHLNLSEECSAVERSALYFGTFLIRCNQFLTLGTNR